jgi:hypothetical protein
VECDLCNSRNKLVENDTHNNLKEWLQCDNLADVSRSDRDAASKRCGDTGLWLLECAEFKEWIYTRGSLLWVEGIRQPYIIIMLAVH